MRSGTRSPIRTGIRALAIAYAGIALFERLASRPAVRAYQRTANRVQEPLMGLLPGWAVVETTGRRTRLPRRVPVGGRREGDAFWLVAGDGEHAAFVKNIEADPHVRIRMRGQWHHGTAALVPDDDPRRRLLRLNPVNSLFVRLANPTATMRSVRIELDSPGRG